MNCPRSDDVFPRLLSAFGEATPTFDIPDLADDLAGLGFNLLKQSIWSDSEQVLRELDRRVEGS